jgi:conjugative relaxase-like TrwC/TraI family protein
MLTIRAMSDGKGYSSRHLEHRDYYAEGEKVIGQWQGRAAELLGLAGEVRFEEFEALRQGLDPRTGQFLRQRRSADRIGPDGTTRSRGRNLYDFTLSAPKSVSVMAIPGGDRRLVEAHEKATAEALQELETHAAARVRQSGANDDRVTGNLVIAVYQHDTSRELDPQLHTHAVAANLTYDGAEGRWKALQASGIYERRAYLAEVYRNSLAREVRSLGYQIENRHDSRGRDCGFEIRGILDELLAKFSQRSRQRDEAPLIARCYHVRNDCAVIHAISGHCLDEPLRVPCHELRVALYLGLRQVVIREHVEGVMLEREQVDDRAEIVHGRQVDRDITTFASEIFARPPYRSCVQKLGILFRGLTLQTAPRTDFGQDFVCS